MGIKKKFIIFANEKIMSRMISIKKVLVRILKIVGGIIVAFVVLVVAAVGLLNSTSVQNKLLQHATEILAEKLETKVEIDSIRIGFFGDDLRLTGVRVDDQEQRRMLELRKLSAEVEMLPLVFSQKLTLRDVNVSGLHAHLIKPKDAPANYQFVLDAFKSDKKKDHQEKKKKSALEVDLHSLTIDDVKVVFNDNAFSFAHLEFKKGWMGKQTGKIQQLQTSWVHIKKKDSTHVDNTLKVDLITYEGTDDRHTISIDSVRWKTDNHKPHKRTGKPKRGWFDDGHMNVVAHLKVNIHHADKDSVCGTLSECDANDVASGLHITDFHAQFKHIDGKVHVHDATVCMRNTTLKFQQGLIQLPSKKKGIPFTFSTSDITGTTLLTDISRPFAPVLVGFKQPLWLSTKFSGTDSNLVFRDVIVKTPDNNLQIKATGGIEGLKDKYKLNVHFNVLKMTTNPATVQRIINQFPVKKFMMKQLRNLGSIYYTGSFKVVWKKEEFRGLLNTHVGHLSFWFALDEKNKYLNGNIQTSAIELGKAMDYPDIGTIACRAGFRFDISKPRTAQMRRIKGGKLPIGKVDAIVYKAKYKFVSVSDIAVHIVSDGAVAEGKINMKGKLADVLCSFSFTNTDEMQKTKIKPGIHFNLFGKKSDEEKAAQQAKKEQKKQEKAAKKEARKAEKEQKKAERKALKEQRKAEKAQRKAEKAQRKAEKAQRKAERNAIL